MFQLVGYQFQGLEGLKLSVDPGKLLGRGGGGLSGNDLLPLRYLMWQQVGRRSSHALIAK